MHEQLTKTLISIIDDQGDAILVSDRLWAYVKDLFPFHRDSNLERCFKHCVDADYIKRVHSHKGDKKRTIEAILDILKNEGEQNKYDRAALGTCLASVAIANGTLSPDELTSLEPPARNTHPQSNSQNKSNGPFTSNDDHTKVGKLVGWVVGIGIIVVAFVLFKGINHLSRNDKDTKYQEELEGVIAQNEIIARNTALQNERKDSIVPLSFKTIDLDARVAVAKANAYAIDDFDKFVRFSPYRLFFESNNPAEICGILENNSDYKDKYSINDSFDGITNLDNDPIWIRAFEHNDAIAAIVLFPVEVNKLEVKGNSKKKEDIKYSLVFKDFDKISKLYRAKYGEPERVLSPKTKAKDKDYDIQCYTWTFDNGTIYLSPEYIVYLSSKFIDHYNNINDIEAEAKAAEEERLRQIEKARQDSIRNAEREEELRRPRNHAEAINDI